VSAKLYVEGGGANKQLKGRCREAFRKLLERFDPPLKVYPGIVACGSRENVFDSFQTALSDAKPGDFIGMLVDSEEPVANIEQPWQHLEQFDRWTRPTQATDEQVLLMTTSMETWIIADHSALRQHYGSSLQENGLGSTYDLESRSRNKILESLEHATRNCRVRYTKGAESFKLLALVDPQLVRSRLPSLDRAICRLAEQL